MTKAKAMEDRLEELTTRFFDALYGHVSIGRVKESGLLLKTVAHGRPGLSPAECAQKVDNLMEMADRDAPLMAQGDGFRKELWALLHPEDTPNLQGG